MLVAVKWREDFVYWPERVRKNIQLLPDGFDILMSNEDYLLHLQSHEQDFLDWKTAKSQASTLANGPLKFEKIRLEWQKIADKFAFENTLLGITQIPGKTKEVADSFSRVVYYLGVNAPTEAIKEIDLIPRGEVFLTEERLSYIKNNLISFLQSI